MKKIFKILLVVLLIGIVLFSLGWLIIKNQPKKVVYEIISVETGSIENTAVATGKVSPRDEILIKPQISGIISEVLKEAGDYVNKDEVIATVKVIPDVSQLSSAESKVRMADIALNQEKAAYERQKELYSKGIVSREEMETTIATYEKAVEDLDASKESLDIIKTGISKSTAQYSNTQIRSTISGMILDVPIKEGNSVILSNTFNDGTTIATVANMNDMIFIGNIDETEVGRIHVGMPMKLTIGAIENRDFEATLEYIAPKGTEENGAILFEIKAATRIPEDVLVRAGYSANAEIVLAKVDSVMTIPESALTFRNDSAFVQVVKLDTPDKQEFEERHITIGLSDGIKVEVKEGLSKDEKVRGNELSENPNGNNKP
jgi:HlyD family secretion protein